MKLYRATLTVTFILFVLCGSMYGVQPAYAKTPTPTPTRRPAQIAKRLENAKRVALMQITNRDNELKTFIANLGKRKNILDDDRAIITSWLTDMQSQLAQWRAEINAQTDIDQLKSLQISWIQRTRFYRVFQPKYHLYVKLAIFNKSTAQITKRIETYQQLYATKRNSDKNNRYEQVGVKLQDLTTKFADINTLITSAKASVIALTPETRNQTTLSDYLSKVQAIRNQFTTIQNKIANAYALLGQIKGLLNSIKALPTATP